MPTAVQVTIDPSGFPEAVQRDLIESLQSRKVNHKFHYDSFRQTHKWLALHQAYSPSRTDPGCSAIYQQGFEAATRKLAGPVVHVIGLGCGGGQKDSSLLKLLSGSDKEVFYTPSDVSLAMVLVARQAAAAVVTQRNCFPVVCDLATAEDTASLFEYRPAESGGKLEPSSNATPVRLFTFFGMIPNFEPEAILPKLASLVRVGDQLLFSANLAPGNDYATGVQKVLPLYDNDLTQDWLMTFLLDLGIERTDGDLRFVIEDRVSGVRLQRIAAYFQFIRKRTLEINSQQIEFNPGEKVRLFFSYRHTPELVRTLLAQYGLRVLEQWIAPSQEEGVFLVSREQRA